MSKCERCLFFNRVLEEMGALDEDRPHFCNIIDDDSIADDIFNGKKECPEFVPEEEEVEETKKSMFTITKSDEDKRLVFGWGNVSRTESGEVVEDLQGDTIDIEDLESAAYEYVLNFRDTGIEHEPTLRKKGRLVESCVFTKEKQKAIGIAPGQIPEGWWVGFYIDDDETWEGVKNGKYQMFSIEGTGKRVPVGKKVTAKTFSEIE